MQSVDTESIRSHGNLSTNKKRKFVMKNVKRILSLVLAVMMVAAVAIIPASAEEVSPYAVPTCDCGKKTALVSSGYSSWTTYSTRNCTHYGNGRDEEQRRRYVWTYYCKPCDEYYYSYGSYEYRTICSGYN